MLTDLTNPATRLSAIVAFACVKTSCLKKKSPTFKNVGDKVRGSFERILSHLRDDKIIKKSFPDHTLIREVTYA
jgi:hypothetical protein